MTLLRIALKSARFRRTSLLLTVLSIAISVTLLLGVDVVRKEGKKSFLSTISQTDLIVGARSGPTNLLLYSVFHVGNATNNVSWDTYQTIADRDDVAWTVPISLGDSHRGFRVMGTTSDYFEFYGYGNNKRLAFDVGQEFDGVFETVLGADVARDLEYDVGDQIIVSHGLVSTDFSAHDNKPFVVTGILEKTSTPVDRTVIVSLAAIEAIHIDWQGGPREGLDLTAEETLQFDLTPTSITAFLVGLENKALTFRAQRDINEFEAEPLSAIPPGTTLADFWRTISTVEQLLFVLSIFVLAAGLIGMLTTILSTLNERRREIAVLRAIGARPGSIVMLIVLETLFVVVAGCLAGIGLLYALLAIAGPFASQRFGVDIGLPWLDATQGLIMVAVIVGAIIVSLIPGFIAYRRSLQDGLAIKV